MKALLNLFNLKTAQRRVPGSRQQSRIAPQMMRISLMALTSITIAAAAHADTTSVVNMGVLVQESENGVSRKSQLTTLSFGGVLNEQKEIQSFELKLLGQSVVVPLDAIRNKTYDVAYMGIGLGQIQGVGISNAGDGLVRLTPKASFVAAGFPNSIEFSLKRLGPSKEWVVLYQGKILREVSVLLSKNPYKMNIAEIIFAPPQLASFSAQVVGCEGHDLSSLVNKYQSVAAVNSAGCNLNKLSLATVGTLIQDATRGSSYYATASATGKSAKANEQAAFLKLQNLKHFGIDITALDRKSFNSYQGTDFDLFTGPIMNGQKSMIDYLMSLGYLPTTDSDYTAALLNVFQVDLAKNAVVESSLGREIFNTVREHTVKKSSAADIILTLLDYTNLYSPSLDDAYHADPSQNHYYVFLDQVLSIMATENLDFQSRDSDFNSSTPIEMIKSHSPTSGSDGGEYYLTKKQAALLIKKVSAAGGK